MSYLARLKQEISQNVARGELTELTKGASVGFVSTARSASGDISQSTGEQWGELESLIAIVAADNKIPDWEYPLLLETARGDFEAALCCYRIMAKQVRADTC